MNYSAFRKAFLVMFILAAAIEIQAQIKIIDAHGNPIPFVQITAKKPLFYIQSDQGGVVSIDGFGKLSQNDTLYLKHISFEKKEIVLADFLKMKTVQMNLKVLDLPAIDIPSKVEDPKYHLFDVCFQTRQIIDDSVVYYFDGKSQMCSKYSKTEYQVKNGEYRVFINENLAKTGKDHRVGISYYPGLYYAPDENYLPSTFMKKNHLKVIQIDGSNYQFLDDRDSVFGTARLDGELVYVVMHDLRKITVRKAFETEVRFHQIDYEFVFRNSQNLKIEEIRNFENLLYYKCSRDFFAKHDKDKKFTHFLEINEQFVEGSSFINEMEDYDYRDFSGRKTQSNFDSEFWKNCGCEFYLEPTEQELNAMILQ